MNKNKAVKEVEALVKQMAGDIEINPDDADLSLPEEYLLEYWAQQRVAFVRDAQGLKLQASANKVVNPSKADEIERQARLFMWLVAAIDMKWPGAKRLSLEIARLEAMKARQIRTLAIEGNANGN